MASIVATIKRNRPRYEAVGKPLGIPWYVVGIIHSLEGSLNFRTHLHNGDPLTARTVHVPAGRPPNGRPPFTWEASAKDALTFDHFSTWRDWSVPGTLYKLESYNGFGYRSHPEVGFSPYLWSFSNHYTTGKYGSDNHFDPTLVSQQCGGAVLLKQLIAKVALTLHPGPRELQLANPPLKGPDVLAAQKLLRRNPFGVFDPGPANGVYSQTTAGAVKRAKWELGYPPAQVNGTFGPLLEAFLRRQKPLSAGFAARRRQRVTAEQAIRKQIVKWALWGVANAAAIGYSETGPRLAALKTPGRTPFTTDCSGFATLCYAWSGAPNPNAPGRYDPEAENYTGTMLAHCRHVTPGAAKPGDLVVWTPPSTGHHVAILVQKGANPVLVSHGGVSGPLRISFSAESSAQRSFGANEAVWLSAF